MDLFLSKNIASFFSRVKNRGNRILIITDQTVLKIYGRWIKKFSFPFLVVPQGEKAKSAKYKSYIEDYLFSHSFGRDTELIAFGGGVVSDLVGFVAANYMRGIAFSIIPTTIIGYVDASVGGKNGINTPFGKNLLGTFYEPVDVCLEKYFFHTLSKEIYQEQCSEIVKMALILDRELFMSKMMDFDRARELKIEVIKEDRLDNGKRGILNFGHTFAHAYERLSNFAVSHGEAVWVGIYFASLLSYHLGFLPKGDWDIISSYYPQKKPHVNMELLYEAMKMDKKSNKGQPKFVLLAGIGKVYCFKGRWIHFVEKQQVLNVLNTWEQQLCIV